MAQTQPLLKKRWGKHPSQGEEGQGQALLLIQRRKVEAMTTPPLPTETKRKMTMDIETGQRPNLRGEGLRS